jgi:hypothetical protein
MFSRWNVTERGLLYIARFDRNGNLDGKIPRPTDHFEDIAGDHPFVAIGFQNGDDGPTSLVEDYRTHALFFCRRYSLTYLDPVIIDDVVGLDEI